MVHFSSKINIICIRDQRLLPSGLSTNMSLEPQDFEFFCSILLIV